MILVINTGSSSIKYKLYKKDKSDLSEILSAQINNISQSLKSYQDVANKILSDLSIYLNEIKTVGYRVVHSGGVLKDGVRATDSVIEHIKLFDSLAPLHNLRAALTIESIKEVMPRAAHFCFFDTTFYNDLPEIEKIYPINSNISKKFKIQKYGFHGISHKYALNAAKSKHDEKIVTIHLGAGCSITAIKNKKPIATSMGFTPLSGLIMQTRCGDVDPGIVLFLVEKLGEKGAREILSKKSGLAGLTDSSGEMLDVLYLAAEKIEDKNYTPPKSLSKSKTNYLNAKNALDAYCNSVIKYIGSYYAILGGVDRLIFTGKIGFGSSVIRKKILSRVKFMKIGKINIVSPNEELAIAQMMANNEK